MDDDRALTLEDGHEACRRIAEYERRMAMHHEARASEPGTGFALTGLLLVGLVVMLVNVADPLDVALMWPVALVMVLLGALSSLGQLLRLTDPGVAFGAGWAALVALAATASGLAYILGA